MKSTSLDSSDHLGGTAKPAFLDKIARSGVLARLERLTVGEIVLLDSGQTRRFGPGGDGALRAEITVLDPRFYSEIAFGGSIGAGEAFMHGYWRCDDLVALVRLLVQNRHVLDGMEGGMARLAAPLQNLFRWINRNTREGARRNIAAHYDLGNDFFALWLDETMMYSSAIYPSEDSGLHEAQINRLDHICKSLDLKPGDHVVEIGTGWGGFALHAAQNYGCRVTTTTISTEQYQKARQRVVDAGLHDRVTVLKKDFRDLEGRFDKLVSIEMIEAVGHDLFATFFKKCSDLLRPDGVMMIQAITMTDQRYAEYRKSVDFIQRYIFPGGSLPSSAVMTAAVAEKTDMRLLGLEDIGLHYATTLKDWRRNFHACLDEVRQQGYPDSFIRMWEFYLCYSEGAFLERAISDVLILFSKPDCRLQRA